MDVVFALFGMDAFGETQIVACRHIKIRDIIAVLVLHHDDKVIVTVAVIVATDSLLEFPVYSEASI